MNERTRQTTFYTLAATCVVLLIVATYRMLFIAPVEATIGIVQKIFYFNIPSAMALYLGVGMWDGQHPTDIYHGGGLDTELRSVFHFCIVAVFILFIVLAWLRLYLELIGQRAQELKTKLLLKCEQLS